MLHFIIGLVTANDNGDDDDDDGDDDDEDDDDINRIYLKKNNE